MKKISFLTLMLVFVMTVFAYADYSLPAGGVTEYEVIDINDLEPAGETEFYEVPDISLYSMTPDWLDNGGRNYYNYLGTLSNGSKLQNVYNKMYKAFKTFAYDEYFVPAYYKGKNDNYNMILINIYNCEKGLSIDEVLNVYMGLLRDNPQFFYFGKGMTYSQYMTSENGPMYALYVGFEIVDEYVDGAKRIEEANIITDAIAEYDKIINKNMSAYAIEKKVHDKIILENTYEYGSDGKPSLEPYAHSIVGSLNPKYNGGVCESYAKTLQLLLNRYCVNNYLAVGYAINSKNEPEKHAWNYVKLDDGKYYCVDTTWDDPSGSKKMLSYKFFNMPADKFMNGRGYTSVEPNIVSWTDPNVFPELSNDNKYYTSEPDKVVGNIDGNTIYKAPDVSEEATREEYTEVTSVDYIGMTTTEAFSVEYPTEETTGDIYKILDGEGYIYTEGLWTNGNFNDGESLVITNKDKSTFRFICKNQSDVSYVCQVNNGATADIYIDGVLKGRFDKSLWHDEKFVLGVHEIKIVANIPNSNSDVYIYGIKTTPSSFNLNKDDKENILDILWLMNKDKEYDQYMETIEKFDVNKDEVINDYDIAYWLKNLTM